MSKFSYQNKPRSSVMEIEAEMQVLAKGELSTHRLINMSTNTTRSSIRINAEMHKLRNALPSRELATQRSGFSRAQVRYLLNINSFHPGKAAIRKTVKHLAVFTMLVMSFSAVSGSGEQGLREYIKSYGEGEGDISAIKDIGKKKVFKGKWTTCPKCKCVICKDAVAISMGVSHLLRKHKGKEVKSHFFNEELDAMAKHYDTDVKTGEDEFINTLQNYAVGSESTNHEKIFASPTKHRDYSERDWTKVNGWMPWYKKNKHTLSLFQCPNCNYESVIGKDLKLRLKKSEVLYNLGVTLGGGMMGFGFARMVYLIRTGEAGDGINVGAAVCYMLGMMILLYFLLKGHDWRDGQVGHLVIKGLGMIAGLGAGVCSILCLGEMTAGTGSDLNWTEFMAEKGKDFSTETASIPFIWLCSLGSLCLLAIIWVNFWSTKGRGKHALVNGALTLGLVTSFGVGMFSGSDIIARMADPDLTVGNDTFTLFGACAIYGVLFMMYKILWGGMFFEDNWKMKGLKVLQMTAAITVVSCGVGVWGTWIQHGASETSMWFGTGVLFGAMILFMLNSAIKGERSWLVMLARGVCLRKGGFGMGPEWEAEQRR